MHHFNVFILLALLAYCLCDEATILKDGNVVKRTMATGETKHQYVFTQEYKYGDVSFMFWNESEEGTTISYIRLMVCKDINCSGENLIYTFPTWDTVTFGRDDPNYFEGDYYLIVEASEGVTYGLSATGAMIVEINEELTLTPSSGIDIDSNGYVYFRTFLCDLEPAILSVSIPGKTGNTVYYNHWDKASADPSKAVGKPQDDYCDGKKAVPDVSKTGSGHVPGWVWASFRVEGWDSSSSVTIYANTEPSHDQITPTEPVNSEVCAYEDCLEIFRVAVDDFHPQNNISVVITPTENQYHDATSIFAVSWGTTNPPQGGRMISEIVTWTKERWEQIPILDPNAENVFLGLYTNVEYKFPQAIPVQTVPYMASVHMDSIIVNVGGISTPTVLDPVTEAGTDYTRSKSAIMNTVSYRYPVSIDDYDVHADYIFQAYVDDDNIADNVPISIFGGMFGGPITSGIDTNADRPGSAEIRFQHDASDFVKGGIFNITTTTSATVADGTNVPVRFFAALSYYVAENIDYVIAGVGSEATDHFTTVELDPEQEYTFYAAANDYAPEANFTLYASQKTAFPSAKFYDFKGSNTNFASFSIPKGDLSSRGPLYIAIDSLYKGEIIYSLTSGENQRKHFGANQIVQGTIDKPNTKSMIIYHSSKSTTADVVSVKLTLDSSYQGGGALTACVGRNTPGNDQCLRSMTVRKNTPTSAITVPRTSGEQYFIRLETTYSGVSSEHMSYSVFAEDAIQLTDRTKKNYDLSNPYGTFFYVEKKSSQDMEISFTVPNPTTGAVAYDAVICNLYPPSTRDDLGNTCMKKTFSSGGDPTKFIVSVDDPLFSGSTYVYVSLYPVIVKGIVSSKVVLFLDTHMDIGKPSYISGGVGTNAYFKVHIEKGHYSEHTLFELAVASEYEVRICASSFSHPRVNSDDCYEGTTWVPDEGSAQSQLEYYFDISEAFGFDFTKDNYIYFNFLFPTATGTQTQSAMISNNLVEAVRPTMELPYDYDLTGLVHHHFYVYDLSATPVWGIYVRKNIETATLDTVPDDFFNQETRLVLGTDDSSPAPHWSEDCELCIEGSGVQYISLVDRNFIQTGRLYVSSFLSSSYSAIPIEYEIAFANYQNHVPQAMDTTRSVSAISETPTSSKMFSFLARDGDNFDTIYVWPCAGEPVIHWSYIVPTPNNKDNTRTLHEPYHSVPSWKWGSPFSFILQQKNGYAFPHNVNVFMNVTGSDTTINQGQGRWAAVMSVNRMIGPTIADQTLRVSTDGSGLKVKFSPASLTNSVASVKYALYAIPAPSIRDSTYDANPNAACGMTYFGQPLYKKGDSPFISLSGSDLTIKSNVNPHDLSFTDANKESPEKNLYYINIVVRGYDADGNEVGDSSYEMELVELSGSMPGITDWWEWLLLILGILIAVGVIAFFIWWWLHKKNASKRYDAMLNEANNDESLNVEDSEKRQTRVSAAPPHESDRQSIHSDTSDIIDDM